MQPTITWIPPWLGRFYSLLRSEFAGEPFKLEDVEGLKVFGVDRQKVRLVLSRLCAAGWITRLSRGNYLALEPEYIFISLGSKWAELVRIDEESIFPCLQSAVGSIIQLYGRRLMSVALFGSSARLSSVKSSTSDIDLLVIVEGLPSTYSKRLEELEGIQERCSKIRAAQWIASGQYHMLDLIVLTREELDQNSLFLLDLTRDAIILYDRQAVLGSALGRLRSKIAKSGAQRIENPSGAWYWDLEAATATTRRRARK
jgi:predicted nucleotidyltransferase